jgi:hypothetical protein
VAAWAWAHLDRLAELEARWSQAAAGATLLHGDLRADNLLLTPSRVVLVDWPHACVGAAEAADPPWLPARPGPGRPGLAAPPARGLAQAMRTASRVTGWCTV